MFPCLTVFVDSTPLSNRLTEYSLIGAVNDFAMFACLSSWLLWIEPGIVSLLLIILGRLNMLNLHMVFVQLLSRTLVHHTIQEVLNKALRNKSITSLPLAVFVGAVNRAPEVLEGHFLVLLHQADGFLLDAVREAIQAETVIAILRQDVAEVHVALRPGQDV